ncbi:DUF4097 family beta strand repeat-containing protein [Amycolatopsis sp., V23-08]|uniref:DUF4097 family beta strand repeat-containing protein n=1 Tax=Amycolatopsis heterodermiae TaxID=3110235 RepID=A0ABU5R9X3_9PSEU|nr:DUF4097 family beta strand repeat-containing protein [Amycolatopsis sp., V23-08]MEA5362928.1 DUF4097 family beta strand repeat-containing protein [Amycolatopsis sp., V23-08]
MQTFATTTPITTTLDLPAGRIHLHATDRTDTTVDIHPANPAKTRDVKTAEQTTVTYTDGVLHIHTPQGKNQYFGPSGSIDVTIALPTGSHIEATTTAAELDSTGRLGNVTFTGAHRHITLAHTAAIHLTATDGDIHIGHLDGPADITTARGDIHITEATTGTVTLQTQAGSITIGAAPGVSATLDAGTTHGRIDNTLKNNGTPELTIHATTTQGDIVARSL